MVVDEGGHAVCSPSVTCMKCGRKLRVVAHGMRRVVNEGLHCRLDLILCCFDYDIDSFGVNCAVSIWAVIIR